MMLIKSTDIVPDDLTGRMHFVPAGWLVKRFWLYILFLLIEKVPV
jgi:hypothetical protein